MARIETMEALRRHYPEPKGRTTRKVLPRLDQHCRAIIALSPFCVLSSQDADGLADITPRGEAPGFVHVLDDTTLAIPDRPGNNRLDSYRNILTNPAVGLLFLIPGVDEVLRVHGTTEIRDDEELKARFEVNGKRPATVLLVRVREAYLHCAKAAMRARLWDPAAQIERSRLPTMGQMVNDQIGAEPDTETQAEMVERYRAVFY